MGGRSNHQRGAHYRESASTIRRTAIETGQYDLAIRITCSLQDDALDVPITLCHFARKSESYPNRPVSASIDLPSAIVPPIHFIRTENALLLSKTSSVEFGVPRNTKTNRESVDSDVTVGLQAHYRAFHLTIVRLIVGPLAPLFWPLFLLVTS